MSAITDTTAKQICSRLTEVEIMLRGLRTVAHEAESNEDYYAVAAVAEGLSERCHQIVDSCIGKMGGIPAGNFHDDEWEDKEGGESCPA